MAKESDQSSEAPTHFESFELHGSGPELAIPSGNQPGDVPLEWTKRVEEKHRLQDLLLERVKQSVGELEKMWQEMNDHWTYEDPFYRFYHGSYKTYTVQDTTVRALSSLRPTVHAVIPALESALQDTNREVRHYASVALQKIKAVSEKRQLTTDH